MEDFVELHKTQEEQDKPFKRRCSTVERIDDGALVPVSNAKYIHICTCTYMYIVFSRRYLNVWNLKPHSLIDFVSILFLRYPSTLSLRKYFINIISRVTYTYCFSNLKNLAETFAIHHFDTLESKYPKRVGKGWWYSRFISPSFIIGRIPITTASYIVRIVSDVSRLPWSFFL